MTGFGDFDVSRETSERLIEFEALVNKWNPKINLVSRNSMSQLRERHIIDSMQIFRMADDALCTAGHWVDLGSGGGFPGLVVAIIAREKRPEMVTTLVESDQRKGAFLRTVARELDLNCTILSRRIENADPLNADIVSARALADLTLLLGYVHRHLRPGGHAFLPKGARWQNELAAAQQKWTFEAEPIPSETEPDAVILAIKGLSCA